MKFGLTRVINALPEGIRNAIMNSAIEGKAKKYFNDDGKRLSFDITARRVFVAQMQQDELKMAIMAAENPEFPNRWLLYEIYRQAVRESHTRSAIRNNILKTVGSPFAVFKKGSEEIDEASTRILQKTWFHDYRSHFHSTPFYGHTLIEFGKMIPSTEPGIAMEFSDVKLFPREHVRPETGEILINVGDTIGIPYRKPPFNKWLLEVGEHDDLGLLLSVAKEVIWKNYSRTDWSRHSEKFGMPILAIKTATKDQKEINRLEQMASQFGSNLWVIIDDQDEVTILESKGKDSHQIYLEKAKYCDEMISKIINGQTGTSDQKSFVGAAEVHERTEDEFIEDNKRRETFYNNETLFPFLIGKGYPLKDREFRYLDIDKDGDDEPDGDEELDDQGNPIKPVKPKQKVKGAGGGLTKKTSAPRNLFR
jgi:hypothetical protein